MSTSDALTLGSISAVLLWYALWCRFGRSRAAHHWIPKAFTWNDRYEGFVLLLAPGFGLMAGGGLIANLSGAGTRDAYNVWLAVPGGVLFLLGVVMGLWALFGLPIPRWYIPPRLRPIVDARKEADHRRKEEKRRRKDERPSSRHDPTEDRP